MLQEIIEVLFIALAIAQAVVVIGNKRKLSGQRRRMRLLIRSLLFTRFRFQDQIPSHCNFWR
jgi:hypothetical protein